MRISTSIQRAALCLIAAGLSASVAPLSARSPDSESKKLLIHEEFTGYGKTVKEAENDALRDSCTWIEEHGGLGWNPDPPFLRVHNMVRFGEAEDKEFEQPMGAMKVVKMQLDITAEQARTIQKQAQHQRMRDRQRVSLFVVLGLVCLLGVVGGYLRLEEATKGYYTRLLRIAAIGVVLLVVAGLWILR